MWETVIVREDTVRMDLFYVERYYGNDEEFAAQTNIEKEDERLKKLKEKISKKKNGKLKQTSNESSATMPIKEKELSNLIPLERIDLRNIKERNAKEMKEQKRKKRKISVDGVSKSSIRNNGDKGVGAFSVKEEPKEKKKNERPKEDGKHNNEVSELSKSKGKYKEKHDKRNENQTEKSEKFEEVDGSIVYEDSEEMIGSKPADSLNGNGGSFKNAESVLEDSKSEQYYPILGSFQQQKSKSPVKRALPKWIAEPIEFIPKKPNDVVEVDKLTFLEDFSKQNLKKSNIDHLFSVQLQVIPYMLMQNCKRSIFGKAGLPPCDICVSAPTGSGKTLSYVLSIVQVLSQCSFRRLQALIVLPSKDLASQVKIVFSKYVAGTQLKVGLAAGVKSFHDEQEKLVSFGEHGCCSNIDILVCTPGRLVDHINNTKGFSLEHLRFLVIDEADRLLSHSYQNWLEKIFESSSKQTADGSIQSRFSTERSLESNFTASNISNVQLPLQKLLFSATMTHNPEKLAPLNLCKPVFFSAATRKEKIDDAKLSTGAASKDKYILPDLLEEEMTICKPGEKPLLIIYYMKVLKYKKVLCFTGSIEATHRLYLVMKACDIQAAEFSSTLNQTQRKGILRDFKTGKLDLLVCSDAMSRGMDIEDVEFVVSYDPPVNMKTYVHRVGRTARAGNKGTALTILSSKEAFHFKKMVFEGGRKSSIKTTNVPKSELESLISDYESALDSLKDFVKSETISKFK